MINVLKVLSSFFFSCYAFDVYYNQTGRFTWMQIIHVSTGNKASCRFNHVLHKSSKLNEKQWDLATFECKFTVRLIRTEASSTTAYSNSMLAWFSHDGALQECITMSLLPHEEAQLKKINK